MSRRLALRSERLTELSPSDLSAVAAAGGGGGTTSDLLTGYDPSINAPCTTLLDNLLGKSWGC
jgi:hypothetical protein